MGSGLSCTADREPRCVKHPIGQPRGHRRPLGPPSDRRNPDSLAIRIPVQGCAIVNNHPRSRGGTAYLCASAILTMLAWQ